MENLFFDLKRLKYLGEGAIIGRAVRIRQPENVVIGDHTIIDDFTYISCELHVGRYCHIAPNVTISGGAGRVLLGDFVGIAAGSSVHAASSDYISASLDMPSVPPEMRFGGKVGEVRLDDHVLLGSHTVVLPNVHLPEGCATAALTIVRRHSLDPWTLYGGFDCHKLGRRDHERLDAHLKRCFPHLQQTDRGEV